MTITNAITNPTTQHDTTPPQKITNQHQSDDHNEQTQDPNDTTQPEQERQCTPGHRDPMVRAACPDGPAAKIHIRQDVDLADTAARSLADEPVVRSC